METTIAQKLEALLKLQKIDSQLDEIKKIRGDLPEEVRDLEDELAGYETRLGKFSNEIESLENEVFSFKTTKKEAEKLTLKYKEQQMNVRNNREYDAIAKEIELQALEMELADKRMSEVTFKIKGKSDEVQTLQTLMQERQKDLENKKKELEVIIGESSEDEAKLLKDRDKHIKNVDDRLGKSYTKIRENSRNGLGVVTIKRGACGGCFNMVPPQRQADIRERKKIAVCEHCGRILADVEDAIVLPTPPKGK